MTFKLSVLSRDPAGPILVAGYGQATSQTLAMDQLHFDALLGGGWASQTVLLDMDAVPFIDSCAIGWLIKSQKHFKAGGGTLMLHSLQPNVRNVLGLLKIERVVPIAADEAAARALLAAKPQPAAAAAPAKPRAKAPRKATKAVSSK